MKRTAKIAALLALLGIGVAGCVAAARAAQGYLALTEWGYRFVTISSTALPDNCKNDGRPCMFATPAPTPTPEWADGQGNIRTFCTATSQLACASGTGTVTEVDTGTGLTGGPVTITGTISLADTTVSAGSYTNASITVDAQGRLTAASSGASSGMSIGGSITGGTATRVPFEGAGPVLADSANLTYASSSTMLTLTDNGSSNGLALANDATSNAGVTFCRSDAATGGSQDHAPVGLLSYAGQAWNGTASAGFNADIWSDVTGTGSTSYAPGLYFNVARGCGTTACGDHNACGGSQDLLVLDYNGTSGRASFPGGTIGVDASHQHVLSSDTGALMSTASADTITGIKTFSADIVTSNYIRGSGISPAPTISPSPAIYSQVVTNGMTCSGSTLINLGGCTGGITTPSGTNTLSGDVSLASGKNFTAAGGASSLDFSLASGSLKTPTGVTTISGGEVHHPRTVIDADTTITTADFLIGYAAVSVTRTATLPNAANGFKIQIVDVTGSLTPNIGILVKTPSGNLDGVPGSTGRTIIVPNCFAEFETDGTDWYTIIGKQCYAPTWTNFSLANSWVAGSTSETPGYVKDPGGSGRVCFRGWIKSGTNSTILTAALPAGFRPGGEVIIPALHNLTTAGWVDIDTSGNVTVSNTGSTSFTLGQVCYTAAN